ncbi:methylated-DNA--[protein]-cysteine S-methyltransferase [Staphylococcus chromogenes]|nr:methylated-DNA--[protein]-cysteine S-methyltransferase [Staphylococcus chromogenes]
MTATLRTPLGPLLIDAPASAITSIRFAGTPLSEPSPVEMQAAAEIEAYLAGDLREFSVPYQLPAGDSFRARVQRALLDIPRGEVWTYGQLAAHLGNPRAARAVGTACATNPLPILIPCHRVVRAGGELGNYLGGVSFKRALLRVEGYTLKV